MCNVLLSRLNEINRQLGLPEDWECRGIDDSNFFLSQISINRSLGLVPSYMSQNDVVLFEQVRSEYIRAYRQIQTILEKEIQRMGGCEFKSEE